MPGRGEVWMVDLGMIQKVRPALVLNRAFEDEDRSERGGFLTTTIGLNLSD